MTIIPKKAATSVGEDLQRPEANSWKVPFTGLKRQYLGLGEEILDCVDRVFSSANFILRGEVKDFEDRIAAFLGVDHGIEASRVC